jgi:DNA-binding GntR family transcriptional regulator
MKQPKYEAASAGSTIARPMSLTASVAAKLEELIIDGSIPLGSMLSENQIAEQFGTSKTPVREAFVQLQSMGLLTVLPQRGGMVFRPTELQVRELCETRLELEDAALRLAFQRNRASLIEALDGVVGDMTTSFGKSNPARYQIDDNAFHMAFFDHCSNSLLREAYELFLPRIRALRTNLSTHDPYLLERSYREHGDMVRLLREDKVDAVAEMLGAHIARTREFHTKRLMELDQKLSATTGG